MRGTLTALHLLCALILQFGGATSSATAATAVNDRTHSQPPLVLARQGSFFVNAKTTFTAFASGVKNPVAGHISTRGMYVQYQIPQDMNTRAYPVIMVHGSGHTGKTFEETPDGRMGWAEYMVRHGIPVYVVDHAGRARSGFDPSPSNQAKLENNPKLIPSFYRLSNEHAWIAFRFGPKPFIPYKNSRFPITAQDEYFAQMVPNTESSYVEGGQSTIDALTLLLERIGPAVILVHSQSGAYGIAAAIARPSLVKAIVSIEPRSCAVSDATMQSVFAHIPFLTLFGDFFGADRDADWPVCMAECVKTVSRIESAGGMAENIYLPDVGIRGNSHMLMMDLNNLQIADIIMSWIARRAPKR